MRRLAFALPCLVVAACSNPENNQVATAPASTTDSANAPLAAPDTTRAGQVNAQSDTLKVVRQRHVFSAPGTPDLFLLTLRGKDVLNGEATFTITDASGQVIFREVLTSADLEAAMVYETTATTAPTPAARAAYVKRRMDEFFVEKNFPKPALPATAAYPAAGPTDRTTWDELRQRPDAVGFQYTVGKEDRRRIAYSPLKKQVVQLGGFGS